ncbi:ribbon-helix-helix domain-containing protein [Gloeobacter morelensis]|uniref:ribbon-helix-helix domain-containing protein n=1 Tax=Gloeobacter morelensis TaxID=2907343 RepID=UPI001E3C18E5|nr:hypothetical protein [Gloeobacter morelensis]
MGINLTPEQEDFALSKLQAGQYRSAEELREVALKLLEAHERAEAVWVEDVREKIDAAIVASEHTPPVDGAAYVARTHPLAALAGKFSGPEWSEVWKEIEHFCRRQNKPAEASE